MVVWFKGFSEGSEFNHRFPIDVSVVLSYEHRYVHFEAPDLIVLSSVLVFLVLKYPHYPYNPPMVTGSSEFLVEARVNPVEYIDGAVMDWILSPR